ncbi:hypothetical protein G0Q06_00765 [Puniceicoccales bacterium CK1056]|uniref:Uncharacterized protein n=1 Tax=Oceanipulchritudo coccoides TaxID=2706888 RepID=A0A6B2LZP4_9BACT|nr:hypothetical protein [Oceanipulchritudo coccoides]NDV60975.1 hypothetical protein [Oceanipulchritudo coccoides]
MINVTTSTNQRVLQGDIVENVEFIEEVVEDQGRLLISKIVFPFCVILTQDCDLQQDYTFRQADKGSQDKYLISVLVAPLYNVEHFRTGDHLSNLKYRMNPKRWKNTEGTFIKNNQNPRYHYLEFPDTVQIPNSVVDFKHYFSSKITHLEKIKSHGSSWSMPELFREDLSQRFASFMSRIGLPDLNKNQSTPQPPSSVSKSQ